MTNPDMLVIPADIPEKSKDIFINNYKTITNETGNLMLFSCDQKMEHMNEDFCGYGIHPDAMNPEHLFRIASQGRIGAMATHPGLIVRYAQQYPTIPFIAKLNAKTNLIKIDQQDSVSLQLWNVDQIVLLRQANIEICGIGLTVYLGSEHEAAMLKQAAQTIHEAHQQGFVTVLWMYPRGKAIKQEDDAQLIAGAAGVGVSLGADFVKIKQPKKTKEQSSARLLRFATTAAGNTKVICSGGPRANPEQFLKELYDQMHIGGTAGNATGRNIFQRSLSDAIAMTHAIASIVFDNKNAEMAIGIYHQETSR